MWPELKHMTTLKDAKCFFRSFSKKAFSPGDLDGKLGIVGVPFGKGQKKTGKDEVGLKIASDTIRATGFIKKLECLGLDICDYGNVQYEPESGLQHNNMFNLDHFVPCIKSVSRLVESVLSDGRKCLVLGGDHSVATGSIHAHMNVAGANKIALVYVDAHPDINTNTTSTTGNIHGMVIALLAQELQGSWQGSGVCGLDWLNPCLSLKNLAYIGTRSVDPGEASFLCKNEVAVFSMEEIDKCGIHKTVSKALGKIDPSGSKSIHLSFDIDALDYFEAPCTTVPVRGGLTLREGIEVAEILHRTGRLSVVDLVEVNPAIGTEVQRQETLDAAKHILLGMFGSCRKGNVKKSKI